MSQIKCSRASVHVAYVSGRSNVLNSFIVKTVTIKSGRRFFLPFKGVIQEKVSANV